MTTPKNRTRHKPLQYLFKQPLALACALMPLLSAVSIAAETNSSVEEVVVTASKRNQSLQDFAGAASVITNFAGIKSLADIAGQTTGFSIVDAGPRNPTGLVIRGLRMDEVGANDLGGDGGAVASYVDNIPLQGYFVPPKFSLKDLQQVEIVRGPQGTLYGNASIGGLIRYVTAKPDLEKYSVRVNAELSQTKHSDDVNYDTDLVVNTPLVDNTLGLRLLIGKTDNAGFIDNDYLLTGPAEDINDDQTKEARISLLWQPTDTFSLNTMYHYQKINVGDRQATNETFTGNEYDASSRYLQPMQGELQLASVDATVDMGWATLTASLNHYDYQYAERADQTDYFIALDEVYYGNSYYTPFEDFSAYNASYVDVVKDSVELRLVSPDDQPLRWLLGGFYSRDDLDVLMGDHVPGFAEYLGETLPDDLDYKATQTEILDEYSVYGEVAYDLTDKWEASVGARYFRYDDDLDVCVTFFPSDGVPACDVGDDVSNDTLGKFSTTYKFTENHSVYFAVAEGYRRGGANLTPAEVTTNRFYNPDKATNYEVGIHSFWLDQRLKLNAAVFNIAWEDIQVRMVADGRSIWANAGEARSQGVEFDTSLQLSSAFVLRAGYSYTDAKLTDSVESIGIFDGDILPGAPRNQWNIGLDYTQSFNATVVDASIGFNRIGEIYTAPNDSFYSYEKLDSYTTANARAGVTFGNWRLGAFVNNIENTRGINGKRSGEWHGDQGRFEYITRPRTVGLSITYKY